MARKYRAITPITWDQGSFTFIVSETEYRTKEEDALQDYNSARDHDGQTPLKKMPSGTAYELIEEDTSKLESSETDFQYDGIGLMGLQQDYTGDFCKDQDFPYLAGIVDTLRLLSPEASAVEIQESFIKILDGLDVAPDDLKKFWVYEFFGGPIPWQDELNESI